MKIALIGQSAFGKGVVEAILKEGADTVTGVFCPPDRAGETLDPVKEAALAAGIPCFQFKRMRSPDAVTQFRALAADLCVMAFVTDIVPMDILNAPRLGTVQYHPSLLPRHRGPSSINWPIIFGEKQTGLTVFWPDAGLDTGPVLLQKSIEIGPDDTLGTVYFNKLFPMGVEAMAEAVRLVREGTAPRIPQDESQATYEGWCKDKDADIDWSKPAQQVYDLIRGCNPRPGAFTVRDGSQLRIFDSELRTGDAGGLAGSVVAVGAAGFEVAAAGGRILVKRVQPAGGKKITAAEYAASAGLSQGARLGSDR
jgi:methionyl-tRNA formyltransferase